MQKIAFNMSILFCTWIQWINVINIVRIFSLVSDDVFLFFAEKILKIALKMELEGGIHNENVLRKNLVINPWKEFLKSKNSPNL